MNSKKSINKKHANLLKGPLEVQFDVTNKCNFRCLHCYNASGENCYTSDELTDLEILKLFKDLKTLEPFNVCFCGGETLLRLNVILKAAKIIKDKVPNLSIVTNGYLLTEKNLDALLDSGINRIQISLDGNTKETYERLRLKENSYEHAINAIKLCINRKDRINDFMISFVPTSFNIQEFSSMAENLSTIGVNSIRVQPLMAMGRGNDNAKSILPSNYQYRLLLRQIQNLKDKYGKNFVQWGDPVDHIIRFRNYFTEMTTSMTIKSNGALSVTPYFPLQVGNVRKHSAIEYWNNGLPSVWGLDIVQKIAKKFHCVGDLGQKLDDLPVLFKETDLMIDIIENMEDENEQ